MTIRPSRNGPIAPNGERAAPPVRHLRPSWRSRWRRRGHVGSAEPAEPSNVVVVDDGTFEHSTVGHYTVVDFWAPWCAPCRIFGPVYEELAAANVGGEVAFASCNVDQSPATTGVVGIRSVPTLVLFDPDGNEVDRIVGLPSRQRFEALVRTRVHRHP